MFGNGISVRQRIDTRGKDWSSSRGQSMSAIFPWQIRTRRKRCLRMKEVRVQTIGKVQFSAGYAPSVGATSDAGTASPSRIPSSAFFWSSLSMLRLPRTRKIRSRSAGVFSAQSAIRDSVCRSKGSVRSIEFFRKCSNHCRDRTSVSPSGAGMRDSPRPC